MDRLSQLELIVEETLQIFKPFEVALEREDVSFSHFIVWHTDQSTDMTGASSIVGKLGEISNKERMGSGEYNYYKIRPELNNIYQGLSELKTTFFISRISDLIDKLTELVNIIVKIQQATAEFKEKIPVMLLKITPELIERLTPPDADRLAKAYNSRFKRNLEMVQGILYFLPIFQSHFDMYRIELGIFSAHLLPDYIQAKAVDSIPRQTLSKPYTDEEKVKYVKKILAPLSGLNPQKQLIMSKEDFNRLIEYTNHLVLTDRVPSDIHTIDRTGISNEHIRYTFYRLHSKLYGTKRINQNFIDFIHKVFSQLNGTSPSTTRSKFSKYPKSYFKDFESYIGDES